MISAERTELTSIIGEERMEVKKRVIIEEGTEATSLISEERTEAKREIDH